MNDLLRLDPLKCELRTYHAGQEKLTCMAYLNVSYCRNAMDAIQTLNIFFPCEYGEGKSVNGYSKNNAPIFLPNTVGGYMPGAADEPGMDPRRRTPNAIFRALRHGYVVASGGVRGRSTGRINHDFYEGSTIAPETTTASRAVGKAPALIVDMKAIIRFLRHNRDILPGNTERIITSGTSAGGALSALAGATGNSADYEPYLKEIGAAQERDDIFAANCYCPIHNLEHADMAYEWQFHDIFDYARIVKKRTPDGLIRLPEQGTMTEKQKQLSAELAKRFPDYVNSLQLQDEEGRQLTLGEDGRGSFLEYVCEQLKASAQAELTTHKLERSCADLVVAGSCVEQLDALTIENGQVKALDWEKFRTAITRMKTTPAFDALNLESPENEEFGTEQIKARHFTAFAAERSEVQGELAPENVVRMLNPITYIKKADTAEHWRIRHGSFDRDTSFAIPVILSLLLKNAGYDVDFALPWGLPHSGDYDLDELFMWIDQLCR